LQRFFAKFSENPVKVHITALLELNNLPVLMDENVTDKYTQAIDLIRDRLASKVIIDHFWMLFHSIFLMNIFPVFAKFQLELSLFCKTVKN